MPHAPRVREATVTDNGNGPFRRDPPPRVSASDVSPATVGDGLDPEAVRRLFEALHRDGRLCGAEVVEINPLLDDRNKTARLAVSLLGSLLQGACACASAS